MKDLGDLKLHKMQWGIFFELRHTLNKKEPKYLKDGVEKYMSITFMQTNENWNNE